MICNWFNNRYVGTPTGIRHAVKGAASLFFENGPSLWAGTEDIVQMIQTPKNVETSVHDSAACTPTRFRVREAHGEYVASGFIFHISAWIPFIFPDMFEPLSKPWPLQPAMSMWCSSNVFSIISDILWPVLPLNSCSYLDSRANVLRTCQDQQP